MRRNLQGQAPAQNLIQFLKLLFVMSVACSILVGVRVYLTEEYSFLYLIWNLFLAWVPLLISFSLKRFYERMQKRYFLLIGTCLTWLLFFPNSPYIITDLIHIDPDRTALAWFDGLMIFSFAMTGLIAGFISLFILHELLDSIWPKYINWTLVLLIFVLSGYGIYLGRVLRWNSWDLFTRPGSLLSDVTSEIENPEALFMTGAFTFFMIFSYLILHGLIHLKYQDWKNDQHKKMPE